MTLVIDRNGELFDESGKLIPELKELAPVGTRAEDILAARNPTDPYRERPELGEQLRAALRR